MSSPLEPLIVVSQFLIERQFYKHGNIIEPVIIYRKDREIQESLVISLPREILGTSEIVNLINTAYREFIYQIMPEEVTITRQGFFMGDGSNRDCLSLIYSNPDGDRTLVVPVLGTKLGSWQEIEVLSGDLYGVFSGVIARRN